MAPKFSKYPLESNFRGTGVPQMENQRKNPTNSILISG